MFHFVPHQTVFAIKKWTRKRKYCMSSSDWRSRMLVRVVVNGAVLEGMARALVGCGMS